MELLEYARAEVDGPLAGRKPQGTFSDQRRTVIRRHGHHGEEMGQPETGPRRTSSVFL